MSAFSLTEFLSKYELEQVNEKVIYKGHTLNYVIDYVNQHLGHLTDEGMFLNLQPRLLLDLTGKIDKATLNKYKEKGKVIPETADPILKQELSAAFTESLTKIS